MHLSGTREQAVADGNKAFPVNKGGLCIKGWSAPATLNHPERLLTPLAREVDGSFTPISWDEALARIVQKIHYVQSLYGHHAIGIFGGGGLTNEKVYLLGKFARVALRTANIDYNGRFCMSSAAAAANKAFGIDRGLPFPLEDIPQAEVVMLIGSNIAETMPPMMQYLDAQRNRGGHLITVDPRITTTAQAATLHLSLTPGTDAALANGLLHILIRDDLLDEEYIRERTESFEQVKALAATYWPERVERITGVPEKKLLQAARMLSRAKSAMILTARGAEQQHQGVNNTLAFINVALSLGLVGKPYSGYGCLTGQGNGQGGREHGQKADQLPGYRKIDDPAARQHIAQVWGIDEHELPGPGKSAYEMLNALGQEGGVRALLVMGSNIVVSVPNALHIEERLKQLDFLVVGDFFLSETARLADIVLPMAQWAEEEGTMTNLEGRVILRQRAFAAPAEVRNELEVLCELAQRLGKGQYFQFADARQVFEELRRASAGGPADYAGITYEKIIAQNGIFWPCPHEEHSGTPRLFQDSFPTPTGRARFHVTRHQAPAEDISRDYPLYLTTGRNLAQYQSGTQTRRVGRLLEMAAEPPVEVHPTTARSYHLANGDMAKLTGGEQSVNRLTNPALDPTSRMPEFKVCAVKIEQAAQ
ncbi:MAG: nitrite reductase [Chloroflexi bacterium]|nr:MAG: nitrite reductase [Chloroflexota bacterium]